MNSKTVLGIGLAAFIFLGTIAYVRDSMTSACCAGIALVVMIAVYARSTSSDDNDIDNSHHE